MVTERRILHIDLDAFYCAVEEIRDPNLKGKPFAVGGRPDQRGVVASCSYPARKFGVRSAMPMAQAIKICPDLLIVRGHYRDYGQISRQVMDYLKEITGQVEQISIDEAFLDITNLAPSSEEMALRIQNYINSEIGLPCSIGIASNKLVAKTATDYGKVSKGYSDIPPNAIHIVPNGNEEEFLAPLPVEALWGVGPKTSAKLKDMDINKVGDLSQLSEIEMVKLFGKWGYALSQRSRGIDDRPLSLKHKAKSISQERTFAQDISVEETLLETIERLSNHVSERLINKHLQATTIRIKLRWSDFTTITRQLTLVQPTNEKMKIKSAAVKLFQQAWKKGEPVRLIGVGVSGLAPEQLNLWDHQIKTEQSETERRLSTVIDELREKFGDDALQWGEEFDEYL
jgi:DNA polymerase-4